MHFFRSLQGKILLFFLFIDVATVGGLTLSVSSSAREALEAKIEEQLRLNARAAAREIEEQLALKWEATQALASNTFVINSVIDALGRSEYLEPFMRRLQLPGRGGEQTDIWLLDYAGRVIARNGPDAPVAPLTVSFAEELWWTDVRDGQPVAVVLQRQGRSRVLLAFPVLYHRHSEGAVVAEFDVALLREFTGRDGFETVLLSQLRPLFGTIPPEALGRIGELSLAPGQHSAFLLNGTFYVVDPLEGFAQERGLSWSLVSSLPAEHISRPVAALRQRMAATGALLAAVFALLVVWGTRSLLRPLQRIEGTMRRIVEGEGLGQRIPLDSRDELGSIARTFNAMLERLEHRTAELERSRDQLALLAHITSASPSAIIMLDTQGQLRVWNAAAERLFGWKREELSGAPLLERLVPAGAHATVSSLIARADTEGAAEAELHLRTRDAGALPVLLVVSRIADKEGQSLGHVFIVKDQREVKRLRESLVESEKMAAVGTLVAGLSHELNNPLAIILGFAQSLIRRGKLDEASRSAVASIERQAERCASLVRALLDFSRKKHPVRERITVHRLFEHVRALVQGQGRYGEIQLEILEPPGELPELEVSVQEVESALLNLITNALDATPPGGTVTVSAQAVPQRGAVELAVVDTGSGMPEEVRQRAFDPFFTTKPVGQGTGLGLSITRNIVEAHGGAIDIETAPGAGTTVRLWLPEAPAAPQARRADG